MTSLVYFKSDFLPLGSSSISLNWIDQEDSIGKFWSVLKITDHGFDTLEAVVSSSSSGLEIYRLSISIDGGSYGFDLGDNNSIPIEKALLDGSYIFSSEGQLVSLSGLSFREFYSRCASLAEHLVTIKFRGDPDVALAQKIMHSVETCDLQEFGDQVECVDSVIIWTRSREQCYLLASKSDHVFEKASESLQGMSCDVAELNFNN